LHVSFLQGDKSAGFKGLNMTMEMLEKRVQKLEDLEEIKKLKVRYARYCDQNYNPDKLAALFTEDAVWGGKVWGELHGREEIRKYFAELSGDIIFSCHRIVAPDIAVDGYTAEGIWHGMTTGILKNGEGFWSSSLYHDRYVKINGEWLMSRVEIDHIYRSPYEGGWAADRLMPLRVGG